MTGSPPQALLLDIEGTTTAISFVSDVLFPFARQRMARALAGSLPESPLADAVAVLRREWEQDPALREAIPAFGDGAACALALMDQDRKSTGLKAIQGILWEEGYRSGALLAHVFDDVPPALRRWRDRGARIWVFSSGSVLAQQLLFGHTELGDLRPLLEGYFDTTTGPKQESGSYARIAQEIGLPAPALLFLSDVPAELDAARDAGMQTGLLERPGNAPVGAIDHPRYRGFDAILP